MEEVQEEREEYEGLIVRGIEEYEQAMQDMDPRAQKKLGKLDGYIAYYEETLVADEETRQKLKTWKKERNQIYKLGRRAEKKEVCEGLDMDNQKVKEVFDEMHRDLDDGISTGERIMLALNAQIDALDKLYDENKEMQTKFKRIKQSLNTLLRRIICDKLTCCLIILLVLGIIALIVVHYVYPQATTTS